MVHPSFFVPMWSHEVGVEFLSSNQVPLSVNFMAEVSLTVPDSLHQQLAGKPLKIVIQRKQTVSFVPDEYDLELNRHIYTARFLFGANDTIMLTTKSTHTKFAEWHTDELGDVRLVWSES